MDTRITPARPEPTNSPDMYQIGHSSYAGYRSVISAYVPRISADRPYRIPSAQTIEQIINDAHLCVPAGDTTTAFLTDRQHTARLGLDDAISQIRRRYDIYRTNLYEIEIAKCATINAAQTWLSHPWADVGSESEDVHRMLQAFYQQQREERLKLWQDVSRLKLLLPESAQQYLSAYRKVAILKDAEGDAV